MIKPADRLSRLSEYFFSTKLKQISQLRSEGKDIINLGIGSPDLAPSEKVIDAIAESVKMPNHHGYQPYLGFPSV